MLSNSSVPFQLILVHPSCPPVILTALEHTFPQSSLCTSLSVEMSIYSSVKTDFSHPPQVCLSYHLSTGQRFLCIIYLGFWLVTVYTGVCFNSFVMVTWTEFRCECGCKSGRLVFMCWRGNGNWGQVEWSGGKNVFVGELIADLVISKWIALLMLFLFVGCGR